MRHKLYWLYIFILIFSPLAFGAVEQWSLTVMEVMSLLALLLFLFLSKREGYTAVYAVPGIIPLLCLGAFFIIQVVPLPAGLVKIISPETYDIYSETTGVLEPLSWISLSLQKKAALAELFRFSSYAAFYILTVQFLSNKDLLKKTVNIVVIFSAVLALSSILKYLLGNPEIFWIRQASPEVPVPFGPFVNRNHYAGLMGMLLPVVLSIFFTLKPRMKYETFRERIWDLLNRRGTNLYMLIGVAVILMVISVFLSRSRGGIICTSLSVLFLGGMLYLKTRRRERSIAIVMIPLFSIMLAAWIGWEPVLKRFIITSGDNWQINIDFFRIQIWKDCISLIKDFPLVGTGLGSFVSIYPKYRSVWTDLIVDHAHNDYLEFLSEGGIVAFLLFVWFIFSLLYKSYRVFLKRKDSYSIYLYIGCLSGMLSIIFFSITDFNLHVASNGLYFFFLAGLAASAANTRLHEGLNPTYLKPAPFGKSVSAIIIALFLLGSCLIFNAGVLTAGNLSSTLKNLKVDNLGENDLKALYVVAQRASVFDPLEAEYPYVAANIEMRLSDSNAAIENYKQAISLSPLNGEYLQRLGLSVSDKGDIDRGEKLIKAGIANDISNASRYKIYVLYLFSKNRKEDALSYIKKSLVISPDKSEDFVMLMMLRGISDEEMVRALPEQTLSYLAFADYLSLAGKNDAAEKAYRDAILYALREKPIKKSYFDKPYSYFVKRERYDDALSVVKQAIAAIPNDGELHYRAGMLYEKMGMNSLAIDEYKQTQLLDSTIADAGKRMEAINSKSGRSVD